jgi:2-methylisocitrate lyase-like PEP mutase family enzyme
VSERLAKIRARFRELHRDGCFVLPNPWDDGTARLFQFLGFEAVASTSTGYAWANGRPDYAVSRADVLSHLASLSSVVDVPVNADFESGFASDPEGVAKSVRLEIGAGVAGLSIEDRDVDGGGLYDTAQSLERLKSARAATDGSNTGVVLVARTEGLLMDPAAVKPAIAKLVAFAEAGADCLYAPGVRDSAHIAEMVRAVAPKPLNVVMMRPGLSLAELADLGVRRVSVGGALARVMWAAVAAAARDLKEGRFDAVVKSGSSVRPNAVFGPDGGSPLG